jgi:hypothetical protein
MGTEHWIQRDWTAFTKCTVILREGVAYVRYNDNQEGTLQTGQKVTLEEGDRIVSLQGCKIEVEDHEGG